MFEINPVLKTSDNEIRKLDASTHDNDDSWYAPMPDRYSA
jgi:succinyl-CoA synthetase beta subunit